MKTRENGVKLMIMRKLKASVGPLNSILFAAINWFLFTISNNGNKKKTKQKLK